MRRKLALTLVFGVVFAIGIAAVAAATTITLQAGNLRLTFGSTASPTALPRSKMAAVAFTVTGKVATTDGFHPPAFREAIFDIDKNGVVNAAGVPVCKGSQLEARDTTAARKVCAKAIVGTGMAHGEIAFPEQKPIAVASPITIFNGGTRGGTTTMYIHAFITVPVVTAIVTTVTMTKIHNGPYGLYVVSKVPVIAGGSGSVLDFKFRIGKKKFSFKGRRHTYLEGRCPTGHVVMKLEKAIFKNEAQTPGVAPETVLSGGLVLSCTPKG